MKIYKLFIIKLETTLKFFPNKESTKTIDVIIPLK